MSKKPQPLTQHIEYHKDGSVWAKGQTANGVPTGYWEWFRKDGTKLRSGHFVNGQQVAEWITYDKNGQKYKATQIKPKPESKAGDLVRRVAGSARRDQASQP